MRWRAPISFSSCRKDKWLGEGTSFVFHCAQCVQPIRQRFEPLISTATRSAVRGLIAAAAEREGKRLSTRQALSPSCAKPSLLAFQLSATILAVCFFSSAHYRPLALVPAQTMPSSRFERFRHKHRAYLQAFVRPLSGWRQASLTWPGHHD